MAQESEVPPSIKTTSTDASSKAGPSQRVTAALCARLGTARGPIVTSCWRPPKEKAIPSVDCYTVTNTDSHTSDAQQTSAKAHHKLTEDDQQQQQQQHHHHQDDKERELQLVQDQFIALVKLNKWLSFYLAALMYSVINMAFIGHQLIAIPAPTASSCFRPLVYLLLGPLLASTVFLAALLIISKPVHFSGVSHKHHRWYSMIGLLVALLILHLPWMTSVYLDEKRCGIQLKQPGALVLFYMVPALLEGWPVAEQITLVTVCAVSAMVYLSIEVISNSLIDYLLISSLTLAFLVLGFVRRRRVTHHILHQAFSDAADLVEAKASLEHQRQQQETLLLSVLPAYVAEQVKRNMVKKIESEHSDEQLHKAAHLSGPAVPNHLSPDSTFRSEATPVSSNHLLATSSLTQVKKGRSRSITSFPYTNSFNPTPQDLFQPKRTSGGSFLWRFPAAAGIVGEFLNSSTRQHEPSGSLLSEAQVQVSHPSPSPNPLSMAMPPTSSSAGHARRGFNELYIRTYNNVSLLYGDIVGFTKLSTKLSSSQLVRLLNDLFSHFDHLADRHKVMRIKILGDCYYGVSGIPEFAVTGSKSPRVSNRSIATDNHAINCVNMGLDMIQYIWQLNVERASRKESSSGSESPGLQMPAFELNMRIGIHTGHIHSGVIGLKKWQFDVWSNDVSIAIHCESSGVAGRVQVTQATAKQLDDVFTLEPAPGCRQDSFLSARDIKTFLIKGRTRSLLGEPTPKYPLSQSPSLAKTKDSSTEPSDVDKIRAATIGTIRQTLLAPEAETPDKQSWRKLAFNYHDISAITVVFRDLSLANLYRCRALSSSFSELCILLILALLGALLFVYLSQTGAPTSSYHQEHQHSQSHLVLISGLLLALCLLLLILIIWHHREGTTISTNQLPNSIPTLSPLNVEQEITLKAPARCSESLYTRLVRLVASHRNQLASLFASRSGLVRSSASLVYLVLVGLIQGHLLVNHLNSPHQAQTRTQELPLNDRESRIAFNLNQHQLTVILLLVSVDLSVDLLTYTAKMISLLGLLLLELLLLTFPLLQQTELLPAQATKQVPPIDALLLVLILWTFASACQIEFINKANFLWRNRLNVDHEELEYISGINKVLLENILPSHVVQYYLTHSSETQALSASPSTSLRMSFSHMRNLGDELYHEQHDSVAVMFASIPHFYEFYDESDISKQGLGCIALLNEIICDFDKLLLKNKFSRIEKIKTIGSSYMAAAGLRPCQLSSSQRNSTASQANVGFAGPNSAPCSPIRPGTSDRDRESFYAPDFSGNCFLSVQSSQEERRHAVSQLKMNLVCIIQFADSLMSALNCINKQSFQVFKLRVGVHAGPVIAGVIGAQRPFYDIWGDCVNIASRMESLGEIGRIQVEEGTAKLLMESSYAENYSIVLRGPIDVKGKGGMITYFVDKKAHDSPAGESLSPKRLNLSARNEARRRQSIAINHQSTITPHLAKSKLGPYGSFTDQRLVGKN